MRLALLVLLAGCADDLASIDQPTTISTDTAAEQKQYDAAVDFVKAYTAKCTTPDHARPRVLVSGFGRFMDVTNNASGLIVAKLGGIDYPSGGLKPTVGTRTIALDGVGQVDLCAVVLPVVWDVAPLLLLKELDAFAPDLVIMNGVGDDTQPLWIELGAINEADDIPDATDTLVPNTQYTAIVKGAALKRANLMTWSVIKNTAKAAIAADDRFAHTLTGVVEQPPRNDNSYLCNNLQYAVGYLMDQPAGTNVALLDASNGNGHVNASLAKRYNTVPRVFFHWPVKLTSNGEVNAGVGLLQQIIAAQLATSKAPTRGDF